MIFLPPNTVNSQGGPAGNSLPEIWIMCRTMKGCWFSQLTQYGISPWPAPYFPRSGFWRLPGFQVSSQPCELFFTLPINSRFHNQRTLINTLILQIRQSNYSWAGDVHSTSNIGTEILFFWEENEAATPRNSGDQDSEKVMEADTAK